MHFYANKEPTLDESVPIFVYSRKRHFEEYVFQFALNKKEIKRLQQELNRALKVLEEYNGNNDKN